MRVRMGGEGTWLDWEIRVELPIRLDQVRAFGIYHFTVHSLADFVVRPKVGQQHTVMGDQQFLLTHNGTTLVPTKDILRLLQQGGVTKDLLALFALFCYGPLALHMCVSVSGGMSGTRGYVRGMSGGMDVCIIHTDTYLFLSFAFDTFVVGFNRGKVFVFRKTFAEHSTWHGRLAPTGLGVVLALEVLTFG